MRVIPAMPADEDDDALPVVPVLDAPVLPDPEPLPIFAFVRMNPPRDAPLVDDPVAPAPVEPAPVAPPVAPAPVDPAPVDPAPDVPAAESPLCRQPVTVT
jgi:3-oxoacyl-[acyl-carrier protein] reductase